ncbi:TMhelix containing protein [Vibrio phage 1.262.O._10N.286.51.A9]|nr:TMhelix containing protein [Vibrio phage 1.262.O._10N.286.51.A9]
MRIPAKKDFPKGTAYVWISLGLIITISLLLSACSLTQPVPNSFESVGGDVAVEQTVNNSLEWWQWIVIGTFIPSIFEMIRMLRKAILGGL